MKNLTIEKAYAFLENNSLKDNDQLMKHSINVAIVAERIADELGLNGKKAYVLGLIHDIGKKHETKVEMRHILDGYNFLYNLGYENEARVCLTHSFYDKKLVKKILYNKGAGFTRDEIRFIISYINKREFDMYDKIVQLADNMGGTNGIMTVERKRMEIILKEGISDVTEVSLRGIFNIQNEIELKLNHSIYKAFPEIIDNINKTLIKDVIKM